MPDRENGSAKALGHGQSWQVPEKGEARATRTRAGEIMEDGLGEGTTEPMARGKAPDNILRLMRSHWRILSRGAT